MQTIPVVDDRVAGPELNLSERLQSIVIVWQGAERGQALADLHEQCKVIAGSVTIGVLPARLVFVQDLDATLLREALKQQQIRANVRFRVPPIGRFDAALVPFGTGSTPADRWLLILDEGLAPHEQVALYAHGLAHLLLNRGMLNLGQRPALDPRDGYGHADTLGELRLLETTHSPVNTRVLETYPRLAALLNPVADLPLSYSRASGLKEKLTYWGWKGKLVVNPYEFTDGRVYVSGDSIRRGPRLRADVLLRAETSLPIALVRARRRDESLEDAIQRLEEQGKQRLLLPFAYLVEDDGTVCELDWTENNEGCRRTQSRIPSREELLHRWLTALGLDDDNAHRSLTNPYNTSSGRRLRYYQEAAVNRTVAAFLQAKRDRRLPRILLTMATGTGKTFVAFQIVWKLKQARAAGNVLFVTDRDFLLGQAMDNDFAPFGEARVRVRGEVRTARDIVFTTYQAIADEQNGGGVYRRYSRDFFDLIIIDECHRGSAQDDSNWRAILDHFAGAIHIGLTATPLRTDNVQTYQYFGDPVAAYSLREGISDGFLAPYRVLRVLIGETVEQSIVGHTERPLDMPMASHEPLVPASVLVANTDVIARHIAAHLRETGPMAKTIVFCVDQQHAQDMRLALERECADMVERFPGYVERIVSDEGEDGKRALGRFGTPDEKLPVIVTTSKLLSTGVDIPTCQNIVLARPVGSIVEFKQIIGRGTRLFPPQKTWFTIVDYAGATHHFFDQEFDGDPETVDVVHLTLEPSPDKVAGPERGAAALEYVAVEDRNGGDSQTSASGTRPDRSPAEPRAVHEWRQLSGEVMPDGEPATDGIERSVPSVDVLSEPAEYPIVGLQKNRTRTAGDAGPSHVEDSTGTTDTARSQASPAVEPATAQPIPLTDDIPTRRTGSRTFAVRGEHLYELAPDGKTLRPLANYAVYARDALESLRTTPEDLRQRWLREEQREEILGTLRDSGIDLRDLAGVLLQQDADPLDLILHLVSGTPVKSRRTRADQLRQRHADFFDRSSPEARAILGAILEKYVRGEVQEEKDVNDMELLKVPPLSQEGTLMELVTRLGGGDQARAALREMQRLLYEEE